MISLARKQILLSTLLAASFAADLLCVPAEAHPGGHDRIMTLNEQILHEPDNAQLLIKRAQERIEEQHDSALAKADLDRARQLGINASNSHEYNFVLGLWHQSQALHPEAVGDFERCVSLDPNHLQCQRSLVEVLLAQQHTGPAIAAMQRFVKSSTSAQTDDYFHLAQWLEKTGKPDEALRTLDQAKTKFGPLPHFEKYAVNLESSQQRFQQALQRHQSLKPYFGQTPQWQFELGMLFQNLGDTAQARAAFQQALATLQQRKQPTSKANDVLTQKIRAQLAALD